MTCANYTKSVWNLDTKKMEPLPTEHVQLLSFVVMPPPVGDTYSTVEAIIIREDGQFDSVPLSTLKEHTEE